MSLKRIFGLLLILGGIASICVSAYIKKEVGIGKQKIERGQASVNTGKSLFNLTPETAPVGDVLTRGAQSKIDKGRMDVAAYESMAKMLMIGGIVAIFFGILLICMRSKK